MTREATYPRPRQHKLGGYETWMGTNRVQLDASELITETILEMMTQLHQKNPELQGCRTLPY